MTNVSGKLFFDAFTSTYGIEMWQSDGTSGGTSTREGHRRWDRELQPDEFPADQLVALPHGHGRDAPVADVESVVIAPGS